MTSANRRIVLGLAVGVLAFAGCDREISRFPENRLRATVVALREPIAVDALLSDIGDLLESRFGTPDSPQWPPLPDDTDGLAKWLDIDSLRRAAGAVSSDRSGVHFGLYREHCVICHGVSGSGTGPAAAMQNPYPRDFRPGVFKFKSTARAARPTREDLTRVLVEGIAGSSMPTFATLDRDDLDALAQYVIYLSIRGEAERRLIDYAATQLDYLPQDLSSTRPRLTFASLASTEPAHPEVAAVGQDVDRILREIVSRWVGAGAARVQVPEPNLPSVERGKAIFHGPLANCASCHGEEGNGRATTLDFDDWTKEFTTQLGIAPSNDAALAPMRQAGALRPRQIHPRKLSWGVIHGGDDPEMIYRRLVTGIAGTPMPGLLVEESEVDGGPSPPVGLTPDQVWDLVVYVRHLAGIDASR